MSKILKCMSFLLLINLTGCSLGPVTGKNKRKTATEDCVVKMVREDIREEIAYSICKDIHEKREVPIMVSGQTDNKAEL